MSQIYTEQQQNLTKGDYEISAPVIQELFTASVEYCNNSYRKYMPENAEALHIDWRKIIAE